MSETQFSWSQFPQYTEEQLKRASKSFKSSVNWAKYKEWVEAGKPFKEHNELLSIDQADQKLENSSYNRPVETKRCNVIRQREQRNGFSSYKSVGKANRITGKRSNDISSTNRTKTTSCNEGEYCSETFESNPISDTIELHKKDDSRPRKRQYL
ncbi:hypothetical protein RhiirA1_464249 [Rhizophagus irregularis]|uniref:Uncharacterized protein n=3 Tax=Rhizophagus irregularis TaxID=588596 RepID=A0A2N0RIF9_9GLOM|nr:hypothetical protein GLOIN_2v1474414 [Rhizophagus irregularis DAOM 181602=DAOM 197198]EXX67000.1 hypothetical protein RirG_118400 [Rhizophagus irregularis DAOM 197198w]PKC63089.1 hypothetical protein RhiirA1_464249 [Rhizophagus irregularis]POG76755.1 hypothetical protein GLOIN_2v1474414 [Rhizophagus irregularis DAOM 181602=DAOM 197198]UZO16658.1 hypothetical protein OCT59_008038 [Rhizophagus irregularis]CAG8739662.1 5536_t:CDS:2 [Rhizophagus irregularis]|eukprot:XP_025183621.1 hypothetical protein GLOIN_2v1474414 [Rhizophagus irregularis DAOM 181602=DAOM 197198]